MTGDRTTTETKAEVPGAKTVRNRRAGNVLQFLGRSIGIVGAGIVAIGGAMPWVLLTVFDIPLSLPGIVQWWGMATVGLAVLALTWSRNFPWLWLALGLLCMLAGQEAQRTVGREVISFKLRVSRALAPTNDKLAQVALPPIEPFPAIGRAQDHLGPGPIWTIWGGVGLMLGGGFQLLGGRLRRTCGTCRTVWSGKRDEPMYCPNCGTVTSTDPHCISCHRRLERNDHFCPTCGTAQLVSSGD